ncbi:hypothetical protein AAE478_005027 [Parahypoxylon ruwenzoriense]
MSSVRPIVRQNNAVDPNDPTLNDARETFDRVRTFFEPRSMYFKFQKVLGFGSSGLVTLWSAINNWGHLQDYAIKAPHNVNDDYFRQEIQWMEDFSTAEHFVQLVDVAPFALDNSLYNDSQSEENPLIIMEYFERCELNELLLGDFGLTTEWDPQWNDEQKIGAVTNIGRADYLAPEQRDQERPLEDDAFGPHTNIWGMGLLMYNALTLYQVTDDDGDWAPQTCPIRMPDGTENNLVTWAPNLVGYDELVYDQFKVYSEELRTLIARCMADDQENRPSLDELLETIQRNILAGDAAAVEARRRWEEEKEENPDKQKDPVDVKRPPAIEDDDLLGRFFQEYLRDPPARNDPYEEQW